MKKIDLYTILNNLQTIRNKNYSGTKFNYALLKNIEKLSSEIKLIQESFPKRSGEYEKFNAERIELAKKYSKKDEKGEPLVENDNFVLKDEKKFKKEYELLKEKNKDILDLALEQDKEIEKAWNEEVEFEFYKISVENLPENLNSQEFVGITSIIED